jgi:GTPase SAR1 family protein
MPIIKPLQLEPTSDIEDFVETVFQPKTLSIIYGPEGVGKTALLYKLHYHLYKTKKNEKGLFIGLDSFECYQYHQTKISTELGVSSIKEKFPSLDLTHFKKPDIFAVVFFHSLHILTSRGETHFALVDGFKKLKNPSKNRVIQNLRQVSDCSIPVIVSMDTKPDLSHLSEYPAVKIQTFQLERPEFLGGGCFGVRRYQIINGQMR